MVKHQYSVLPGYWVNIADVKPLLFHIWPAAANVFDRFQVKAIRQVVGDAKRLSDHFNVVSFDECFTKPKRTDIAGSAII